MDQGNMVAGAGAASVHNTVYTGVKDIPLEALAWVKVRTYIRRVHGKNEYIVARGKFITRHYITPAGCYKPYEIEELDNKAGFKHRSVHGLIGKNGFKLSSVWWVNAISGETRFYDPIKYPELKGAARV